MKIIIIIILTGIIDDIKSIKASQKLVGQVIAALVITCYGKILLQNLSAFGYTIDFGIFAYPITVLFIVACVNIINLISKFRVKADSYSQKIKELSGGNAQKLIVAREMSKETPLIIACEPTRGIDIGAIEFIHDQLVEKRNNGDSVLLVSSELSEIMDLSDRIYVIYEGEIVGEFKRGSIDEKALGLLMVGGKNNNGK